MEVIPKVPNQKHGHLLSLSLIHILTASEVAFLRAEGALRKWNMGGEAKDFYETGVKLSFEEHGASGAEDLSLIHIFRKSFGEVDLLISSKISIS